MLEDDADISENFAQSLEELIAEITARANASWELVNLGNSPKHKIHYETLSAFARDFSIVSAKVFPKRTTSLLWSRAGAQRFLEETQRMRAPVDQHLHSALSQRGTGLATIPALVPHAMLASDINSEPDAAAVRQVRTPSAWYRLRRALRKRAARRNARS